MSTPNLKDTRVLPSKAAQQRLEQKAAQWATIASEDATPPAAPKAGIQDPSLRLMPLDRIVPDPDQPRHLNTKNPQFLEFQAHVKHAGVLQPITVRPLAGQQQRYKIVSGERRYEAARARGDTTIPVRILQVGDDEVLLFQLAENIHRQALSVLEEADAFTKYLEAHPHVTQRQLAQTLGKPESYVSEALKIAKELTPNERSRLAQLRTSEPARAILLEALRAPDAQTRAAILEGRYTVRQARDAVTQTKEKARQPRHYVLRHITNAGVEITLRFPKPEAQVSRDDLVAAFKALATEVFKRAGYDVPPSLKDRGRKR